LARWRGAGVGLQTVRYYERRGLLPPPRRRHSGQRVYESATIDLLRAVKTAQAVPVAAPSSGTPVLMERLAGLAKVPRLLQGRRENG
jgi:MerR HTH family regulatory protein